MEGVAKLMSPLSLLREHAPFRDRRSYSAMPLDECATRSPEEGSSVFHAMPGSPGIAAARLSCDFQDVPLTSVSGTHLAAS